jgi:hypothetical protein
MDALRNRLRFHGMFPWHCLLCWHRPRAGLTVRWRVPNVKSHVASAGARRAVGALMCWVDSCNEGQVAVGTCDCVCTCGMLLYRLCKECRATRAWVCVTGATLV